MKMKLLLVTLGFVGSFASSGANASVPVTVTTTNYGNITGQSVTETIYKRIAGDMFADYYFFQVSQPSLGTGIVSNIEIPGFVGISGLIAQFGTDNGAFGLDGNEVVTDTLMPIGSNIVGQKNITAGSYFFKISGTTSNYMGLNLDNDLSNGIEKGAYFFNASAATTPLTIPVTVPVPEPETWAMLVAGIGLIGLQLRRRSNAGKISIS